MKKGFLFVVEGLDGVGKTTAIANAAKQLKEIGYDVVVTSESMSEVEGLDNSFGATLLNSIELDSTQAQADPTAQSLMIMAARRAHYQNVLVPLLREGKLVLMDRFYLSTFFNYQAQCADNGKIYSIAMGNFKPDYHFLLSTPKQVAAERLAKRKNVVYDPTDQHALSRFDEIQTHLTNYVKRNPGTIIDASVDEEQVCTRLVDAILYAYDELTEQ